ncbi:Peptidase family M23 [Desulfurobacterium pacificum]|uniref:Peptidase family M23 n=1 Tax=Desulfurobacterium pacificum TaxID=240166 RepID=A0ABY1N9F7_9BACT|nr:M23 family metallopeptidase [Desulfurobacterium pacificum]SMP04068.1 Peptidase family M23 [Desulfurobacterium pacificum]
MDEKNDRYQIIVIEDELANKVRRFSVSKKLLLFTFFGGLLFTILITAYAIITTIRSQNFYLQATTQIESLRTELQSVKQKNEQLSVEVAKLKKEKQQTVKELAKRVEIIDELMRKIGINPKPKGGEGGISISVEDLIKNPDQVDLSDLIPSIDYMIKNLKTTPLGFPAPGKITSGFGLRINPITKRPEFHLGLDIANIWGTPVRAPADGTVIKAGWCGLLGNCIEIKHNKDIKTYYGHLSKILVRKGEKVKRGEIIGLMGNSGRSTGPHLHYSVIFDRKFVNPDRFVFLEVNTNAKKKGRGENGYRRN